LIQLDPNPQSFSKGERDMENEQWTNEGVEQERGLLAGKTMNRRRFLKLSGLGLAGASLLGAAGCGGGGEGSKVTLRWSMWADSPEDRKVWEGLANAVTKAHPNIKVNLETISFQDYWDKLQTQLAGENEGDIVSMQQQRMPGFAARGAMQPLQQFIEQDSDFDFQDFFPVIEEGLSFQGAVHALAYDLGPLILYYNKDLFDAAGVRVPSPNEPMSWDQFRQTATELTNKGAKQYGYIHNPVFDYFVPWLWSGGGDYMNADKTECTLGSSQSIAALEFVVGLFTEGIAAPITDLANPNFGVEQFFGGQVGMYLDGPWQIINVRENAGFDFGLAPMPAGSAGSITWVAGSGFGVSNTTDYAEEAWKAIKVITSTDSLKKVAKAGRGYPARKSAVPAFENQSGPPKHVEMVQQVLEGEIGEARPFETTATWQETVVMLQQDLVPVLLGRQSVRDAVAETVPKFNRLLREHQEIVEQSS
jgi:multiple sugar transport system substrate-binding protein